MFDLQGYGFCNDFATIGATINATIYLPKIYAPKWV